MFPGFSFAFWHFRCGQYDRWNEYVSEVYCRTSAKTDGGKDWIKPSGRSSDGGEQNDWVGNAGTGVVARACDCARTSLSFSGFLNLIWSKWRILISFGVF